MAIVNPKNALAMLQYQTSHKPLLLARALAIQQYAELEEILNGFCAYLLGVPLETSGIIFFRLNNARTRIAILDELLKSKHGATYSLFWNSLSKTLRELDITRNKIVHWKVIGQLTDAPSLIAPNWLARNEQSEALRLDDIYDFTLKAEFCLLNLEVFTTHLRGPYPAMVRGPSDQAWLQIFSEPLAYPPPSSHPICQIWLERQSHHQSSQE